MNKILLVAAGVLGVVACTDAVTDPDTPLVPGPQFAKWVDDPTEVGCTDGSPGVKYQLHGTSLKITGTSGWDRIHCEGVSYDIMFSGGDGNDTFLGGTGDDHLIGGNGDDMLDGGPGGFDVINAGLGDDVCRNGDRKTDCEYSTSLTLSYFYVVDTGWLRTYYFALHWTDEFSIEDGFQVERCTGAGCTSFSLLTTVSANVTGLAQSVSKQPFTTPPIIYTYRVRAYGTGWSADYSNPLTVFMP